jgi:hypothetical protein
MFGNAIILFGFGFAGFVDLRLLIIYLDLPDFRICGISRS